MNTTDNGSAEDDRQRAPRAESRAPDVEPHCPHCAVAVGEAHVYDEHDGGCDVARCLVTGLQRQMCDADHDCGRDVWTGWWPGQFVCERLGLMLGPGLPDLNRLYSEATWDPAQRAWVKPT